MWVSPSRRFWLLASGFGLSTSPAAAKISKPAAQKQDTASNSNSKHQRKQQAQARSRARASRWQLSQAASGFDFAGRQNF
jgi:hypothetical protein